MPTDDAPRPPRTPPGDMQPAPLAHDRPEPKHPTQPGAATEAGSEPAAQAEALTEAGADPIARAETETGARTLPEPVAQTGAATEAGPETVAQATAGTDPIAQAGSEAGTLADPTAQTEAAPVARTGAEAEAGGAEAPPRPRNPFLLSRGMKIPKHPQLTTGRVRGALRQGTYERKECEAVLRVARPGDRVLELGGGIGYMSTLLSVKAAVARVVSYEANPALIPYIRSVHAANGVTNVDLRNALLSPAPGDPVPFYIRRNFLASSMDPAVEKNAITQEVAIARHALAPVLEDLRPDVLVCDIEGAEADLLPAGDWSGLRAAVIELHPQWIGQAGVAAVFAAMTRAGLTYFPKASEAKVVTFLRDW